MNEPPSKAVFVPAGEDRFQRNTAKIWGQIPLAGKVSASDTAGAMYAFEHRNMGKGGPPRHIHHNQDEWFYVVAGEYIFEVGDERFQLGPGDSIFAPRKVPHAWASVGDSMGTVITVVTPVGTFEKFMQETTEHASLPAPEGIEQAFAANDMLVVGPPLSVE